ncbi:MAG: iron ABC transporter permease [Actinobacteria bacterium]|jgi:iron complex transport system permease protein|nr:iron ABC transporter permease [Actinomycetota bacterium]
MSGEELRSIWRWQITLFAALLLLVIALLGISFGPIHIPFTSILRSFLGMDSHLSEQDRSVLFDIRLPRVILAALVGSALATSGAVYQTVFRNPLADPYLLGAAAGAGLGATIAITNSHGNLYGLLPAFAFSGAILAVVVSFFISGKFFAEPNSLLLSGIAVGSFATAVQTYLQQRHSASLRPVYSWILGELTAASWQVVTWSAIYIGVALIILLIVAKQLDGLMLTDEEAYSLGINPNKIRVIAVIAATLATATAVAASGLIGFVGIVVPHLVRGLTHRVTNRALPTIAITGAAFLVLADLGARTLLSPAELPIGIITAFVGAPFFLFVLRRKRLINQ